MRTKQAAGARYLALAPLVISGMLVPASAQKVVRDFPLPADGPAIDVTKPPYNAKGDGVTDDTEALLKAFRDAQPRRRGRGKGTFVYIPNGIYLVSGLTELGGVDRPKERRGFFRWHEGTLRIGSKKQICGQSREKTIIRLKDNSPGYDDPERMRWVLDTSGAGPNDFGNYVCNLTVNTGRGNPGAAAIRFHTSNTGALENVRAISEDGAGRIGVDLWAPNPGPGLISDVEVIGFDIGIRTRSKGFCYTFEHITLKNQNVCGLHTNMLPIAIRKLTSRNRVPAVRLTDSMAFLCLVDASLTGGDELAAAIENPDGGAMFCRNVEVDGYGAAIASRVGKTTRRVYGPHVEEMTSHPPVSCLPNAARTSLNLPVEETAESEWGDPADWVSITDYGAVAWDKKDDSQAIQKAIDSGAETVYFPYGRYHIEKTVALRGRIRRVMGMYSKISKGKTNPQIRVADGEAPVVVLERFCPVVGIGGISIEVATKRTVVIKHGIAHVSSSVPGGKLFVEDMCGGLNIAGKDAWLRQLNPEIGGLGSMVVNDGGTLWILGIKTERERTVIHTKSGGSTELLGIDLYPFAGTMGAPAFIGEDCRQSLVYAIDNGWTGPDAVYEEQVRETRDGKTWSAWRSDAYKRGDFLTLEGGVTMPLYVGYQSEGGARAEPAGQVTPYGGPTRTCSYGDAPPGEPTVRWTMQVPGSYGRRAMPGPAVARDGVVYFSSREPEIHAVRADDGEGIWRSAFERLGPERQSFSQSAPAVARNMVLFGTAGYFYGVHAETGKEAWRIELGGVASAAPAIVDDLVIFACTDGWVYAAEIETGWVRWQARAPSEPASPVASDGKIAVVGLRGGLMAVDPKTGRPLWTSRTGAGVRQPAIAEGLVLAPAEKIYAFDPATGEEVWSRKVFVHTDPLIAVSDGKVLVSSPKNQTLLSGRTIDSPVRLKGVIHVLDARTGEDAGQIGYPLRTERKRVRGRQDATFAVPPCVAGGVLVHLTFGSELIATNIETGKELWRRKLSRNYATSPTFYDGVLYVGGFGEITALAGPGEAE